MTTIAITLGAALYLIGVLIVLGTGHKLLANHEMLWRQRGGGLVDYRNRTVEIYRDYYWPRPWYSPAGRVVTLSMPPKTPSITIDLSHRGQGVNLILG